MTLPAKKYEHLNKYVKEINGKYAGIREKWTTSLDDAIHIGELLTQCKMKVEHGDWLPWVEENMPFSDTSAQRFIRTYGRREELKSVTKADLIEGGWEKAVDDIGAKSQQARKVTKDKVIDAEEVPEPKQIEHKTVEEVYPVETKEWAVRTDVLKPDWSEQVAKGSGEMAVRVLDKYIDEHLSGRAIKSFTNIKFSLSVQVIGEKKVPRK